jgi:hypothetical protein
MRVVGLIALDFLMVLVGLAATLYGGAFLDPASISGGALLGSLSNSEAGWFKPVGVLCLFGGLALSWLGVFRLVRRLVRHLRNLWRFDAATRPRPVAAPPTATRPPPRRMGQRRGRGSAGGNGVRPVKALR